MTEEKSLYDSGAYKKSRAAYLLECTFEYFVAIVVSDSFLSTQLSKIGFTDGQIGIISSVTSLAFLFSMISIFAIHKIPNITRFSVVLHSLAQVCFIAIYLLPLLSVPTVWKQLFSVVSIFVAYCGNYLVTSIIYRWGNSFVAPHRRARFSATKESVSLIAGMLVSLSFGAVMDAFDAREDFFGRCIFASVAILIFAGSDLLCLLLMKRKNPDEALAEKGENFVTVVKRVFASSGFRKVLIAECIWRFGIYMTIGFLGTYKTVELGYSLTVVQIISIAGCLARVLVSRSFGTFSDRNTYAKGFSLAVSIASVAFLCCAFTAPATGYLIFVYSLLYFISQAGTVSNLLNTMYSYVDSKYFVQASSIKSSISGVVGFLSALLAGKILSSIQKSGNSILGVHIYGQQVLATISFLVCVSLVVYSKLVLEKEKVKIQ